MRRTLGVGVVLLLALGLIPVALPAQTGNPSSQTRPQLRQNYPNPFNPETWIPFDLPEAFFEGGKPVVVSIRIYNVLQQPIAIPQALNHPDGNGVLVENLVYTTPGDKLAYWDGRDRFGRKVASAVYYMRLEVNGERFPPRKMVVAK